MFQGFAAKVQIALVVALLTSFFLIGQQFSRTLYQAGLLFLFGTVLMQFAFGNLPPGAGVGRSMRMVGIVVLIVGVVFGLGILLAPLLTQLGR